MATLVETSEGLIFIDPGVALAPRRYGLPPHELELKELSRKLEEIHRLVEEASILVITHYHRDHYLYRQGEEEFYRGKVVYAKNPYSSINPSQRIRAYVLYKKMGVEGLAKSITYADGRSFELGRVKLDFSPPLFHGECGTKLGWVISVAVEEDSFRVVHASDVQGFMCSSSLDYILKTPWNLLVVSGPPTYLGKRPPEDILKNLISALKHASSESTVVVDHHLLRDRDYRKYLEYLGRLVSARVLTAAEFMGVEVKQLEAYRDTLWSETRLKDP